MGKSKIGWTDYVWNPIVGCSKVSAGCKNCWAERMAFRLKRMGQRDYQSVVDDQGHWTGNVVCLEHRLQEPFHWRKSRRIFVCSMSALFHPQVPFEFIAKVFEIMASPRTEQHTFMLLTKRPDTARHFYNWVRTCFESGAFWSGDTALRLALEVEWPLPNVWFLVTIEQNQNLWRADELLRIPAVVRGICLEPMLERIGVRPFLRPYQISLPTGFGAKRMYLGTKVDWLIIGGESGPQHRPLDKDAVWDIVDAARAAGIAVWLKQDSGPRPGGPLLDREGKVVKEWPDRVAT